MFYAYFRRFLGGIFILGAVSQVLVMRHDADYFAWMSGHSWLPGFPNLLYFWLAWFFECALIVAMATSAYFLIVKGEFRLRLNLGVLGFYWLYKLGMFGAFSFPPEVKTIWDTWYFEWSYFWMPWIEFFLVVAGCFGTLAHRFEEPAHDQGT